MTGQMIEVKSRPRGERAAATRRSIMRAAHQLFCVRGYQGTTMAAIAAEAGVAIQTVYFVFHTKPELLTAVIDAAVRGDTPVPPEETSWWRESTSSPDARDAISAFVRGVTEIQGRVGELDLVVRAGAGTDPELGEVWAHHERLRQQAFRSLAQTLEQRGFLRDGLGVGDATDILMTLMGPMTYLAFTRDRLWDDERFVAFTRQALADALLR
jgi:AcrR family transcriptional regulator